MKYLKLHNATNIYVAKVMGDHMQWAARLLLEDGKVLNDKNLSMLDLPEPVHVDILINIAWEESQKCNKECDAISWWSQKIVKVNDVH